MVELLDAFFFWNYSAIQFNRTVPDDIEKQGNKYIGLIAGGLALCQAIGIIL